MAGEAQGGAWVNLRDDRGRIQGRYHPGLGLLIIQRDGVKTAHDLRKWDNTVAIQATERLPLEIHQTS